MAENVLTWYQTAIAQSFEYCDYMYIFFPNTKYFILYSR